MPLLVDIVDSTAYLYSDLADSAAGSPKPSVEDKVREWLVSADLLIGFEENLPYGFVGAEKVESCCRLIGPYLYRDYLGRGYGLILLDQGIKLARGTGLNPVFALMDTRASWAVSFFSYNGFERIADDPEFIKRWHDGLLANRQMSPTTLLMARLLDAKTEDGAGE